MNRYKIEKNLQNNVRRKIREAIKKERKKNKVVIFNPLKRIE